MIPNIGFRNSAMDDTYLFISPINIHNRHTYIQAAIVVVSTTENSGMDDTYLFIFLINIHNRHTYIQAAIVVVSTDNGKYRRRRLL